ncbi:IS4/IS5 family transposase [Streptomyces ipomoeae]|nr:IS4/IS5 family transposase [Streptomyces ipomoeae]
MSLGVTLTLRGDVVRLSTKEASIPASHQINREANHDRRVAVPPREEQIQSCTEPFTPVPLLSAGVIDSQSVKADAVVSADSRGFDGGKQINGRKRHVVVGTLGLLLGVMVTSADVGDRAAAKVLLHQVADAHHRLALIWADGGYTGSLVEYCLVTFALVLAIVKRSDDMRGFVVLPKRWIVERLFAHLMRTRRLARDFEPAPPAPRR